MTDIKSILAKSNGTTLYDHTREVINLVDMLCYGIKDKDFITRCRTAAVLHDIGKCTSGFQDMMKNKIYPDDNRHNVLSWAFAMGCLPHDMFLPQITDAVLYHHSVPVNNDHPTKVCDILDSMNPEDLEVMSDFYKMFEGKVIPLESHMNYTDDTDCLSVPLYRASESLSEGKLDMEAQSLMLRAILVKADRTASDEDRRYDHEKILNNDIPYLHSIIHNISLNTIDELKFNACLEEHYDMDRLKVQQDIAEQSISLYSRKEKNTMMVNASAGFGKTLLGLMSIVKRGRKTIWCVPTREIAISTFMSVKTELEKMDYPLSVCLFFANEIQDKYKDDSESIQDYDITVSVIDSMLSSLHNNNMGHLMYSYLVGDMIFDEYHNVVGDNALFASTSLLLRTRMWFMNSYSLLLSATPVSPYHMGLRCKEKIYEFNPEKYKGDVKINFYYDENMSKFKGFLPNSFIIGGSVSQVQNIYLKLKSEGYDNLLLYHSLYDKDDMDKKRDMLFGNFGKHTPETNLITVSTNLIGTGLDVSAKNIYELPICPSDSLQRVCGRSSRFGEYDEIEYHMCDFGDKDDDGIGQGVTSFIGAVYDVKLWKKWKEYMKEFDGKVFTKNEFYKMVDDFNLKYKNEINRYYEDRLVNSRKNLGKISLKTSSKKKTGAEYLSKKTTLRGDGHEIFVAVPYGKKNILFSMDSDRVKNIIEKMPDSTDMRRYRWKYYTDHIDPKTLKSWKYKYGMTGYIDCNFDVCAKLAYCSETPLPVKNMTYDPELGARIMK